MSYVLPLIAANIIIFILQLVFPGMTEAFALVSAKAFAEPWRLFTSMFLHAGLDHLFFNMYGLMLFGPLLESRIGSKRFLALYLISGVLVSIVSSFFYNAAVGASGAIMAVIGALIIFMPRLQLLLFFAIPMPLWIAGILWVVIDTLGILVPSGVANIGHLTGMACGLLYGVFLKGKKKKVVRTILAGPHLEEEHLEEYMRTGRL